MLEFSGRFDEAEAHYSEALDLIQTLPSSFGTEPLA